MVLANLPIVLLFVTQKLNQIVKSMGATGKDKVTHAEFSKYFETSTLRELRLMTTDLLKRSRCGRVWSPLRVRMRCGCSRTKAAEAKAEAKGEAKGEEKKP